MNNNTVDIDWYFKDGNGNFVHVASAGGRLPQIIEENDQLMNSIHSEVIQLPTEFEITINPTINQFVSLETDDERTLYLTDFVEMAKRGFISVDKTILGNFEDTTYHIVAYPKNISSSHKFLTIYDEFLISKKHMDINNSNFFNLFDFFESV